MNEKIRQGPSKGKKPEGKYSNYFEIGHSAFEFLLDFAQLSHEGTKSSFHTRIITSPESARALQDTLAKSIKAYEKTFGTISGEVEEGAKNRADEE